MKSLRRPSQPTFLTLTEADRSFDQHFVVIDGFKTHYRIINPRAQEVIVIVHGVTGDSFDMVRLATVWAEQGYGVIIPDLPGHGKSDDLPITQFSGLGEWLNNFIRAVLHAKAPVAIVGNSFGSAICYTYAAHHPLATGTMLVLGCPTPSVTLVSRGIQHLTGYTPVRLAALLYLNRTSLAARVRYLISDRRNREAWYLMMESEKNKVSSLHTAYAAYLARLLIRERPYQRYHLSVAKQRQTLLAIGDKDNVAGKKSEILLRELMPKAAVVRIPKVGHILHLESYRAFAVAVSTRLRSGD